MLGSRKLCEFKDCHLGVFSNPFSIFSVFFLAKSFVIQDFLYICRYSDRNTPIFLQKLAKEISPSQIYSCAPDKFCGMATRDATASQLVPGGLEENLEDLLNTFPS